MWDGKLVKVLLKTMALGAFLAGGAALGLLVLVIWEVWL